MNFFPSTMEGWRDRILPLVPMILSLSVHEWAHAWSAWKLGDDTAAMQGRLTLNPLAHIDPIGTVLLPLLGIPFGWAKPVPVNPTRFRRDVTMSTGMAITAFAGPLSNLLLALISGVTLGLLLKFAPSVLAREKALWLLLVSGIELNVGLALFNLLPLPPLDGSRIVERFVPYSMRDTWENVKRFGPMLLLAFVAYGGYVLAGPRQALTQFVYDLVRRIAE